MDKVRKGEVGEYLQKVGGVGLRHSDHPAKVIEDQVEDWIEDQRNRIRIRLKIRIRTRMIDSRGRHLSEDDNVLL